MTKLDPRTLRGIAGGGSTTAVGAPASNTNGNNSATAVAPSVNMGLPPTSALLGNVPTTSSQSS